MSSESEESDENASTIDEFAADTYGIADGFADDCERLIDTFLNKKSLRFSDFLEIWKQEKFQSVFSGRPSLPEFCEFYEEAVNIAARFFLEPKLEKKFQSCVAGLYSIYMIRHTASVLKNICVRVLPRSMKIFYELYAFARKYAHYDVLYILCSMLRDGVFRFVATSRDYGLEPSYLKYFQETPISSNVHEFRQEFRNEINSTDIFDELDLAFKEYYDAKCLLCDMDKSAPPKELDYMDAEFPQKLVTSFNDLSRDIKKLEGKSKRKSSNKSLIQIRLNKAPRRKKQDSSISTVSLAECMKKKSLSKTFLNNEDDFEENISLSKPDSIFGVEKQKATDSLPILNEGIEKDKNDQI